MTTGTAIHADEDAPFDSLSYAARLLDALDGRDVDLPRRRAVHPATRWWECGAMALTGPRSGPALMCPLPLASCADGALLALQALAAAPEGTLPPGGELLGERAALSELARNGRIAPGGACRLLNCADGRIALTLARLEDWASLPVWLATEEWLGANFPEAEISAREAIWGGVASAVAGQSVDALVESGRLLSLAIAADRLPVEPGSAWFEIDCEHPGSPRRGREPPLVVDLSSLWAGPLCTHLLAMLGARVIKVESTVRPDGARAGNRAFYDLLNHGKASVALDLQSIDGRDMLRRLLATADIVVEASRPRALLQLGIDPAEYCAAGRALTWISLTGHGRRAPEGAWIAFGDDAAIAAGLGALMQRATGEVLFCGDAIADPLAGMHAALAAWCSHRRGGARRISLSLRGVLGHCIRFGDPIDAEALRDRQHRWTALLHAAAHDTRPPRARDPRGAARPFGADTAAVADTLVRPRAAVVAAR